MDRGSILHGSIHLRRKRGTRHVLAGGTVLFFDSMFGDEYPHHRQVKHLASLWQQSRLGPQILVAGGTVMHGIHLQVIRRVYQAEVMPCVSSLSSRSLATRLAQTLGLAMEVISGGRSATVPTRLGELLLQGPQLCLQSRAFCSQSTILPAELFELLDLLLQSLNGLDRLAQSLT